MSFSDGFSSGFDQGSSGGFGNPLGDLFSAYEGITGGNALHKQAEKFQDQALSIAMPFMNYAPQFAQQLNGAGLNGTFGLNSGVNFTQPLLSFAGQQAQSNNPLAALGLQGLNTSSALSGVTQNNPLSGIGGQYAQLLGDPSSFFSSPLYQAAFGQGQQAVNSTLAAQGLNGSGAQLAALQKYGQSFGQQAYNQDLNQLSSAYSLGQSTNQQQFNQYLGLNNLGMNYGQQQFQDLLGSSNFGLNNQQNQFNQLSALSGLSLSSPSAAINGLVQANQYQQQAGQEKGAGISSLISGIGGIANIASLL